MPVDTSLVGKPLAPSTVVIERTPVMTFAAAVKDDSPIYQRADAAREAGFGNIPMPPTYGFSFAQNGTFPELQPEGAADANPIMELIGNLMRSGGLILHGEQEFCYHAPVIVGDTLHGTGRISDIYEKTSSSGSTMTFISSEAEYRKDDGTLALTTVMTLVHRA